MPGPTEHKTVQARILAYAQEIGWTLVSRAEAARRRGETEPGLSNPGSGDEDTGWKTRAPLSRSIGQWRRLPANIHSNRDFMPTPCNQSKFWNRLSQKRSPSDR